jgi:hypothetical protein
MTDELTDMCPKLNTPKWFVGVSQLLPRDARLAIVVTTSTTASCTTITAVSNVQPG